MGSAVDRPINEIFGGALACIAFAGTIWLSIIGHDIPAVLQGLDGAAVLYYFGSMSYNIGVSHGIAAAKGTGQ